VKIKKEKKERKDQPSQPRQPHQSRPSLIPEECGWAHGGRKDYTVLEIAQNGRKDNIVSLLGKFITNPGLTRHELRVKLGMLDEVAAEVFALTVILPLLLPLLPLVFFFFAMAQRLPTELQTTLCRRAVGSMKQNILRKDSEAFKSLARILLFS